MRPKKRILLADSQPLRYPGLTAFVLRVNNYRVDCVGSGKHDLRPYDALLICGDANVMWSKGRPRTPTVWYAQQTLRDVPCGVRVAESEGMAVLLFALHVAVARKRGPKPRLIV